MGYSPEIFIESPPENLLCGICLETFKDCHVLGCGHKYCHYCLQLLLSTEEQLCAFDRKTITEYKRDEKINQIVQNLATKCPEETCEWMGALKDSKAHKCKRANRILIPPYKPKDTWFDGLILGDKETSLRVLSYLEADDVCRTSRVNKNWRKVSKNNHLWKFLFKKEFDLNIKLENSDWKVIFFDNYKFKYPKKFEEKVKEVKPILGEHFNKMLEEEKVVEPIYDIPVAKVDYIVKDPKKNPKKEAPAKILSKEEEEILLYYTLELSKRENEKIENFQVEPLVEEEVEDYEDYVVEEDIDYDYSSAEEEEENYSDIENEVEEKIEPINFVSFKTNDSMYAK
jgi:hypothetical protein